VSICSCERGDDRKPVPAHTPLPSLPAIEQPWAGLWCWHCPKPMGKPISAQKSKQVGKGQKAEAVSPWLRGKLGAKAGALPSATIQVTLIPPAADQIWPALGLVAFAAPAQVHLPPSARITLLLILTSSFHAWGAFEPLQWASCTQHWVLMVLER